MRNEGYVIGDTQLKPGVKDPMVAIAYHICEVRPKFCMHLGDHWDMPSLSKYDKGKKSHRKHNYLADIKAGNDSMARFWEILFRLWPECLTECKFVILEGNHEIRITRAIEYGPYELAGLIEAHPRDYSNWHIMVPFLKIIKYKGIHFSHYFQQDKTAGCIGTANALITKRHRSCIAGHTQGFDYKEALAIGGTIVQCMIIGSSYYHDEPYKGHTNTHWRGTVVLSDVRNGMYDFSRHSMKSLDAYLPST